MLNLSSKTFRTLALGVLGIACFTWSRAGWAYPTLTRKGYTSCSTCHYNPSGGGALTSYGKYIAKEVYGTFNDSSNAARFIIEPNYEVGTFEEPRVVATVMARAVQTYIDTPQIRRKQVRSMQFDFEGGYAHDGWQLLGAVGPRLDSAIEGKNTKRTLDWRRYWAGRVTQEYAVRVGRFMPEYGIYHPHHNIPTRKGLFFNHNEEPEIVQATKFSDTFDFTLGYLRGRKETQLVDKKGYVANVAYKTGMARYGISRIDTKDGKATAGANGAFAQFGFAGHFYTLAEVDRKVVVSNSGKESKDDVGYLEIGNEIYKGVSPYFALEYKKSFTYNYNVKTPSIGLQLHPLTHTEVVMQAGRILTQLPGETQASTQAFLMVNTYF
jgi:hypothetical protein